MIVLPKFRFDLISQKRLYSNLVCVTPVKFENRIVFIWPVRKIVCTFGNVFIWKHRQTGNLIKRGLIAAAWTYTGASQLSGSEEATRMQID